MKQNYKISITVQILMTQTHCLSKKNQNPTLVAWKYTFFKIKTYLNYNKVVYNAKCHFSGAYICYITGTLSPFRSLCLWCYNWEQFS